ncbi:uncharacterized protein LOC116215886 isoform X2 [Punica granatum]|uniref:Uncharacterized protein LOC116215886 isoform X2 n=1 Tax=Punica granatum TaxID=22663 RepID=A0A6P8EMM6_PUNGR|nr:uncharacterized protein LOC116215886 isoform X2 [Punica granatum]
MDMSNHAGGIGIQLLDHSNYKVWRTCMESYLVGEDLWDVVDGNDTTSPEPEATADEIISSSDALKKWKRLNAKAEFALKRSISQTLFDRIIGCKSAHEIWQTLRLLNEGDKAEADPTQTHRDGPNNDAVDKSKLETDDGDNSSDTSSSGSNNDAAGGSNSDAAGSSPDPFQFCGSYKGGDLRRYQDLHKAALSGDWETAERTFESDPEAKTAIISTRRETALHVATSTGQTRFVEKLVQLLSPKDLEMTDFKGQTALHIAAICGSLDAVKTLLKKNQMLTQIVDTEGFTALHSAAYFDSKDVMWHLTLNTTDDPPGRPFTGPKAGELIQVLVWSGSYDICLHLLERYPNLAITTSETRQGMLSALTDKPSDFESGCKLHFWQRCIYHLLPEEVVLYGHMPPRLFKNDVEDPDPAVNTQISPASAATYWTPVRQWSIKIAWKALEYFAFGAIKCIKDEKYKHKCTRRLVEIACQEISRSMTPPEILQCLASGAVPLQAVETGTVEIVTICLQYFPYMIWIDSSLGTMHQEAIILRQEKVLNLLLDQNVTSKLMAIIENEADQNLLHLAAKLSPYPELSSISCPALQMQRELQWFQVRCMLLNSFATLNLHFISCSNHRLLQTCMPLQAVEEFAPHSVRLRKDKKGLTAQELFTREHTKLLQDAERWMKDTANSCMVVSTLIATVVFAATFTVPGGNVEGKGIPLFLSEQVFMLFAVSDALALFSSTTAILMFLSILTARYAEEDFLRALPKRLILGFASLFLAIATMMVAFGAALHIVLSDRFKWIFLPIIALTSVPVALFVMLQLPLFIFMVKSTYGSGIFHPKKIW